ncbi:MAG TPA: hypothetical protein VJR89_42595, partial [Polyangiales bacterium]|nr:hypothetical protein [Polyangiales bacterium]
RTRYLCIAVDDADEADERSLSLLVELADAARARRLLLATTSRSGASARTDRTFELLRAASVRVSLAPLTAAEVEALLRSLFGEVRNLNLVAGWMHGLAHGNPEAVMSLAQHLLDRDFARYEGGIWILPSGELQQVMPHSLRDAWSARIAGLSSHARALAETLALVHDAVDDELLRDLQAPQLHAALDELIARRMLVAAEDRYTFAQVEIAALLRAAVDTERLRSLHRGLAAVYLAREQLLLTAHHLQQAGDEAAAASAAQRWCVRRSQGNVDDVGFWKSTAAEAVLRNALRFAEAHACPPRDSYLLRRQLLQISVSVDVPFADIAVWLLERLRNDTGIALLPADASTDPHTRARQCLTLAQARYEATPEAERGLAPLEALRELATIIIMLSGAYGRRIDVESMGTLLPLLAPFRGLGPLLELLHDITSAAVDRARGRRFSDHAASLFARLEQPMPGLDEVTRRGARSVLTYYLALEHAQLGSSAVLEQAELLECDPAFEPLAWHVRTVKHLYSGEAVRAEACRERTELLSLRNPDTMNQLATSILYETEARALSGDLIALKTALPQLERLAQRDVGWRLFQRTVRGEYEMLRGHYVRACEEFEHVLARARPGAHTAWSRTASSYTATLVAMGAFERAIAFGERACQDSAEHRVNPLYSVLLRASVARAYAELGDHARGQLQIEHVLTEAEELGMTGVPLGCAYEAAARVALASGDLRRFEHALESARTHYTQGGSEPVAAKYRRLMADAMRRWSAQAEPTAHLPKRASTAEFSKQWT